MSTRDPEARYENQSQILDNFWTQRIKTLHTCLPGLITRYDPATKRARVQPALRLVMRNSAESFNQKSAAQIAGYKSVRRMGDIVEFALNKPAIINVPVRQCATGRYLVHQEIIDGDVCLLHFSERGIEKFKQNWGELSDPTVEAFFAERDGFCVPWGTEDINPVDSRGVVIQDAAGDTYVHLTGDTVTIRNGQSTITVGPDKITLDSPVVEIRGATDTLRVP